MSLDVLDDFNAEKDKSLSKSRMHPDYFMRFRLHRSKVKIFLDSYSYAGRIRLGLQLKNISIINLFDLTNNT